MRLSAAQMRSLPAVFLGIDDPRRQGRRPRPAHGPRARRRRDAVRHARLQGDRRLARRLSPRGLQRFRVRRRDGRDRPPGLSAIRSLLIRVDPARRDAALGTWHEAHGSGDSALAIDGKTIRGAIDDDGKQAHVPGIIGHDIRVARGQNQSP